MGEMHVTNNMNDSSLSSPLLASAESPVSSNGSPTNYNSTEDAVGGLQSEQPSALDVSCVA